MAKFKKNQRIKIGLLNDRDHTIGKINRWEKTELGNLKINVLRDNGSTCWFMGKRADLFIEPTEE